MDNILLVILDGIGDRGDGRIEGKTVLQYAKMRNLDDFAKKGMNGIMDPIAPGIRPGSDTAHLSLLGYNPYDVYTGRGPFEAAGISIKLKEGDVAFRCNFATVDEKMIVKDRRAGRIKQGTGELARTLDGMMIDDVKIIFKEAVEHRGVLVFRGKNLSSNISDVDTHIDNVRIHESKPLSVDAEKTADIVNRFVKESYQILKEHPVNMERVRNKKMPANIILPRGAGIFPKMGSMDEKYNLKSACVTGISLVKGICRLAGMDIINVKGATGGVDTNIDAKIECAVKALNKYDFVIMNIKAPDIFGHDGDAFGKVKMAEKIDKALEPLKSLDCLKIFTADHSTPVTVKNHSADPVPITITGKDVRVDDVKHFDEISCAKGGLCRIRGRDLMNIALDLTNRSEKFGA
ncbi:2,3-bisphosphoglycerate-independent phosphoglycerate mutase [archaeon]|nr:2,3-bisphosphoglycerate-independent phosphoglycerate mutase [archaeon]